MVWWPRYVNSRLSGTRRHVPCLARCTLHGWVNYTLLRRWITRCIWLGGGVERGWGVGGVGGGQRWSRCKTFGFRWMGRKFECSLLILKRESGGKLQYTRDTFDLGPLSNWDHCSVHLQIVKCFLPPHGVYCDAHVRLCVCVCLCVCLCVC